MINHKAFCGFRSNEESQNLVIIPDLTHNLVLAVCPHPDITENPQEQKKIVLFEEILQVVLTCDHVQLFSPHVLGHHVTCWQQLT